MHGLDKFISSSLFPDYSSTLNPFLFLRNLSAALIIVGLAIALFRRFILRVPHLFTNSMDRYSMIIIAVITLSGVFLEATKIVSYTTYQSMVEEYADLDDEQALGSLESYWVKEFGVASPNVKEPFDRNVLARGLRLHEMNCAACHSSPQWAVMSYGVARIIKPAALRLDRAELPIYLWYIHFLACFIGLAYFPFSKMFHIFASPLSLLVNAVMSAKESDPANVATRQIIELDACTHCGTCTLRCAVGMWFEEIPNLNILPSEKIASVKALAAGKSLTEQTLRSMQEGLYLCTNCYRCTEVCPVGINLQDLWFNVREALLQKAYPEILLLSPLSLYRGLKSDEISKDNYSRPFEAARMAIDNECSLNHLHDTPIDLARIDKGFKKNLALSDQGKTFSYCFVCTTCTTACPVVRNFDNPPKSVDLVPHQIIHAAIAGLDDLVFSSRMLWYCLGCYQCQEACPQGVRVTDVLYELKNLAAKRLKGKKPMS
jgi:heterodisulfide reductase subunit C